MLNFKTLAMRSKTEFIVIHHTADQRTLTVKDIHKMHQARGWSGIAYHWLIHKDGTIEVGRPEPYIGAHCKGSNSASLGICLSGNFEIEYPTQAQLNSLKNLLVKKCKQYKINKIYGHCEKFATACPGKNMRYILPKIKDEIKKNI